MKKTYNAPKLRELGAMADLTLGGGMSSESAPQDGKGGTTNFMDNNGGNL